MSDTLIRMEIIRDPKDSTCKEKTCSVLISRSQTKKGHKFRTAIIKLFDENDPHKKLVFPKKIYECSNTEKIRIRHLNCSYYLEGNDLIINDLEEIHFSKEKYHLIITGIQKNINITSKK